MSIDIIEVVPSKFKAWVGAASAVLAVLIPVILQATTSLPEPWPTTIGLVVAALTWLGVYKTPYKPSGTVLVTESQVTNPQPPPGEYTNPYR